MATIITAPEIRVGRDWFWPITEQSSLGNPIDLSGQTIELCIKKLLTDSDANALYKSATLFIDNRVFGQYWFKIPNAITSGYASFATSGVSAQYEVIYKDSTGIINTRLAGTIPITPSITVV